jgi:hypothetical protein
LNSLVHIPLKIGEEIYLAHNPLLGKYQDIQTYDELLVANKLYLLEDKIRKNLYSNNEKKINKIKV